MLRSIVGQAQINAMIALVQTLPPGDFAEVGVYQGGTASHLYQVCLQQGRWLHLFDTFTGTPNFVEGLDRHKVDDEFAAREAPAEIKRVMPVARLYIGEYPNTHPADLPPLAFIHCDCDQYLSYRAVIDRLWPHVVPGGIMLFDDYPYLGGAKRAVEESFAESELRKCFQRYYVVKPNNQET
jgi:O-methyltransferase